MPAFRKALKWLLRPLWNATAPQRLRLEQWHERQVARVVQPELTRGQIAALGIEIAEHLLRQDRALHQRFDRLDQAWLQSQASDQYQTNLLHRRITDAERVEALVHERGLEHAAALKSHRDEENIVLDHLIREVARLQECVEALTDRLDELATETEYAHPPFAPPGHRRLQACSPEGIGSTRVSE